MIECFAPVEYFSLKNRVSFWPRLSRVLQLERVLRHRASAAGPEEAEASIADAAPSMVVLDALSFVLRDDLSLATRAKVSRPVGRIRPCSTSSALARVPVWVSLKRLRRRGRSMSCSLAARLPM